MGIALAQKREDPAAFRPGLSRLPLHVAFRNAQRLAGHWQGVPLSATRCSRHETRVDTSLALTSFKEFTATLTTVVHRNYRFRFFGF